MISYFVIAYVFTGAYDLLVMWPNPGRGARRWSAALKLLGWASSCIAIGYFRA
jgi:hypothetical protein